MNLFTYAASQAPRTPAVQASETADKLAPRHPLATVLDKLPESRREFARDLLRPLRPSPKQREWMDRLYKEATTEQKPAVEVGDLSGVLALFDKAAEKLKKPAIVLLVQGVGEVRISVAGPGARVPGSLNVADNASFGSGEWYGRVLRSGSFEPSARVDTPEVLLPALRAFAERPAKIAAEHGKLTGKCCFCNVGLKDERSTDVGYGPICAKNYGLPWGR